MVNTKLNINPIVVHPDERTATGLRIMTMVLLIQNRPKIYYGSAERDKTFHRYTLMSEKEDV